MKTQVLEAIGERDLQPVNELNAALAANDRLKYYFSLLQTALNHADRPEQPALTLRGERIACGLDDAGLDAVVAATRKDGLYYRVPGCAKVMSSIARDSRVMAAPILASTTRQDGYRERLEALLAALPAAEADLVTGAAIAAVTRVGPRDGSPSAAADSLHQLVMDLHKELNLLQAASAEEILDGAFVYSIADADRPFVAAFMAGLNRTARLKFNHPGLATTATRAGKRLVIQNDIGTTDAHVIVVHVEDLAIVITYADVHLERLQFFQSMLARYPVSWQDGDARARPGLAGGGEPFYLATGRFEARDSLECRACLEWLGSRIVFLIDWNRARKELRGFLRGGWRIEVLRWAAEAEVGHRGFLELGGARTVNEAIEATAGSAVHFGDRLCDVIGDDEAEAFIRFVVRAAAEGLSANQSQSLIRDRIRTELQTHFSNEERRLLSLAADHAGLIFEIATLVRDGMLSAAAGDADCVKLAQRARRLEHDADQLVIETREAVRRRPEYAVFQRLLEAADDAADELEDVAFLLGLLPEGEVGSALEALKSLADLALDGAQEWLKATHIGKFGVRDDTDDFLTAIDRVAALEHEADDAQRMLTEEVIKHATDFRQLHLYTTMGDALEEAADALKSAGLILRDHVLCDVLRA
jgi:uncharacterized protein Yka (UPF0111/DUF47 family)